MPLWRCPVVGTLHLVRQVRLPDCRLLSANQEQSSLCLSMGSLLGRPAWSTWVVGLEDAVGVGHWPVNVCEKDIDVGGVWGFAKTLRPMTLGWGGGRCSGRTADWCCFFRARSNGHGCWRSVWGTDIQEKEETDSTEEKWEK